jgi:predicted nucleic acid-binding protein
VSAAPPTGAAVSLVIDASVAVKWLIPEQHADAARRALTGRYSLLAPDLIWPEVGNTLWKKALRGELTVEQMLGLFSDLSRAPMEVFASRALAARASTLALQYRRPFYDSLYVALAYQRRSPLVTADRRLYNALRPTPLAEHLLWIEDIP